MTDPNHHSSVSIRVVLAFIDFLSSVQSSIGTLLEQETVGNLKEAIITLFNITPSMLETTVTPNVSLHEDEQNVHQPPSFSIGSTIKIDYQLAFLFHHFHLKVAALGFYDDWSHGQDYKTRKSHSKQIFKDAIAVLKEAGHARETFNYTDLADGLKTLGNKAMHCEMYNSAIEMYTFAVSILKDNAVYFCNRAAAFTKVGRFEDAIRDCREAIKLKPGYVLAYYRLGCAYYEQGKNLEAIREGFLKVLELDPQNHDAMVSVQLADSKLRDEVASLQEQIGKLSVDGAPAAPAPVSVTMTSSGRQSTVLVFRGPEEGGNGKWELVEDMEKGTGTEDTNDTISVADFIDTHVRNIPPPE